jgi:hypothetical protein
MYIVSFKTKDVYMVFKTYSFLTRKKQKFSFSRTPITR